MLSLRATLPRCFSISDLIGSAGGGFPREMCPSAGPAGLRFLRIGGMVCAAGQAMQAVMYYLDFLAHFSIDKYIHAIYNDGKLKGFQQKIPIRRENQ